MAQGDYSTGYGIYDAGDGYMVAIDNDIGDMAGPSRQPYQWNTLDGPLPEYQQVSNPGGVLAPALLAATAGYLAGEKQYLGSAENGMNNIYNLPNSSIPMEGPMRFAGRGIPPKEHPWAPDYGPDIIDSFPWHGEPGDYIDMPDEVQPLPPLAIGKEPHIPPSLIGRHPPDSTMIVPEVVYPPEDTRSEWQKWKDSFTSGWEAK